MLEALYVALQGAFAAVVAVGVVAAFCPIDSCACGTRRYGTITLSTVLVGVKSFKGLAMRHTFDFLLRQGMQAEETARRLFDLFSDAVSLPSVA